MGARRLKVLVIDDERMVREVLADLLSEEHAVVQAATLREGVRLVGEARPEVIFCDIGLPDARSDEILPALLAAASAPAPRVIVMSGAFPEGALAGDIAADRALWLAKPFDFEQVTALLDQLVPR